MLSSDAWGKCLTMSGSGRLLMKIDGEICWHSQPFPEEKCFSYAVIISGPQRQEMLLHVYLKDQQTLDNEDCDVSWACLPCMGMLACTRGLIQAIYHEG